MYLLKKQKKWIYFRYCSHTYKIFCLHLAEAETCWKSLLKFSLYAFLHKCAATENFLKTEEMKAGRRQVRKTTFQVTTSWKNKGPYIVFFVILKGKHIPFLHVSLHSGLYNTALSWASSPPQGYARGTQLLSESLGLTLFPGLCYSQDWELQGDLQTGTLFISSFKLSEINNTAEHPRCSTYLWCYGGSEGRCDAAAAKDPHISCGIGECKEWHAVPTGTDEAPWKCTSS